MDNNPTEIICREKIDYGMEYSQKTITHTLANISIENFVLTFRSNSFNMEYQQKNLFIFLPTYTLQDVRSFSFTFKELLMFFLSFFVGTEKHVAS